MLLSIRFGVWCAVGAQKNLKIFLFFLSKNSNHYVTLILKKIQGIKQWERKVTTLRAISTD